MSKLERLRKCILSAHIHEGLVFLNNNIVSFFSKENKLATTPRIDECTCCIILVLKHVYWVDTCIPIIPKGGDLCLFL